MSYYKYMVSVYRSCRPELNRTLRSSSVERSMTSSSSYDSIRHLRSASVGPSSYSYMLRDYSAMPFTYAARQCQARAASLEPVNTYSRAYYDSFANKYNNFDYKVMSYAHQLDAEETTRCYVNRNRYENRYSSPSYSSNYYKETSYEPYTSNYDYYSARKYDKNYLYDSSDALGSFRHYRLSNQTLNDRNQRAKSPLITREIDRYYKPRPDYIGDVNSGPNQGFRHYSYRHVPYFGGSDYYHSSYMTTKKRMDKMICA